MTSSGPKADRKTAVYGVVGYPVKHSLSPAMHNSAFRYLGISAEYRSYEVKPEDLPDFLKRINKLGISGLNLTVPHKLLAVALVDALDESAKKWGAVNTILFNEKGAPMLPATQ